MFWCMSGSGITAIYREILQSLTWAYVFHFVSVMPAYASPCGLLQLDSKSRLLKRV